ncbi:MAG: hypothetical protein QOI13_13, partial [Paraburkholderia sp.]|nr:hypothetical protein [Paraburkholderia sp.]
MTIVRGFAWHVKSPLGSAGNVGNLASDDSEALDGKQRAVYRLSGRKNW